MTQPADATPESGAAGAAPGGPEPLPRRRPGTHLASELNAAAGEAQPGIWVAGPAWSAGPGWPGQPSWTPPPEDVLRRLLDGLRQLS